MQYQVSLHNFGIYFDEKFDSFCDAISFAKSKGFEATIHDLINGGVAGTWSPISGVNKW